MKEVSDKFPCLHKDENKNFCISKKIKTIKRQISKHKNIVMTAHHTTSGNVNSF